MVLYLSDIQIKAYRCPKPTMDINKGRTWTQANINLDSKEIKCWIETKYGMNMYFENKNIWYRLALQGNYFNHSSHSVCMYAFNPLSERVRFKTREYANR